ncbi:MAG: transposase [Candidatus Competibacteraceae bacterium]|nr:transposase [Candidatus Competibacteraceae bacterium]
MTEYRRAKLEGATYFFTVNCAERDGNRILIDHINMLRQVFRTVKDRHPFEIDAMVVLPEHLHCIWSLPPGDADYKTRWALIKAGFSRVVPGGERRSVSRLKRGERGIWQRRYWEHVIRDEQDFERHIEYIHWNPVKHGWVSRVRDWPHSSFHAYVQRDIYPADWACEPDGTVNGGE